MEEINVKEFGIYPTTREPQLWLGCRAIITNKTFDVPFDRWSESLRYKAGADNFISWVNHIAIPKIELCIKRGQKKFCFSSDVLKNDCNDYDALEYVIEHNTNLFN